MLAQRLCRTWSLAPWLVFAALGLAACSEHSFLDDFPPYPPAEPFLEEQQLLSLRLRALREEEERQKNRSLSEAREASIRDWRRLEEMKVRGLRRLEAERERRAMLQQRSGPRKLEEWERIMP